VHSYSDLLRNKMSEPTKANDVNGSADKSDEVQPTASDETVDVRYTLQCT
jgi:hypothetical protein